MTAIARRHRVSLPPNVIAERIFARYRRVAYSAAQRVAKRSGRPYQDLAEEAASRLGELAAEWGAKYDPERSAACTWVYTTVYWYLTALCARPTRKREVPLPEGDVFVARAGWLERIVREMGEEGRALLGIVLEAPAVLAEEFRGDAVHARLALMDFLRAAGWAEEQIDAAWTEIQQNL